MILVVGPEKLLEEPDRALYPAKESGRNQVASLSKNPVSHLSR